GSDANATSFALSRNGDVAYTRESASEPSEIWVRKKNAGAARQITQVNGSWKGAAVAKGEILRYKTFDGMEIEGLLLKPPGSTASKLPTIMLFHGGPV